MKSDTKNSKFDTKKDELNKAEFGNFNKSDIQSSNPGSEFNRSNPDSFTGSSKKSQKDQSAENKMKLIKRTGLIIWIFLILVMFYFRNYFTMENLLTLKNSRSILTIGIMLGLFALKSVSFFLYAGLLYLVDGILFPYPIAIGVSVCGSLLMFLIPYQMGKALGSGYRTNLESKYPLLLKVKSFQDRNPFSIVLLMRTILKIPCDVVSLYCGSCAFPFMTYLISSILCALPHILTYPILGKSLDDPGSPEFLLALSFNLIWALCCFLADRWIHKHS